MKIFLNLFILQTISVLVCAQDWSLLNGNRAQECQQDENFCMGFCRSFKPETVKAQCGKDLISCICTTPDNHSVKVRFIEERQPAPPTTPAPTPSVEYMIPAESARPNPSVSQYPELLVCDSSPMAAEVCNYFCITEIGGFAGFCNISDYTCVCQGVSPAVVQSVPISAVLQRPIPPPVPAPLPPSPQNFWNPITPNHPNYNPNSVSNTGFPNQQQQFQPLNSQYTPSMTSNIPNSQPHPQEPYNMYPQPQLQQSFQVFDQMSYENPNPSEGEGIGFRQNHQENPIEQTENSSSSETTSAHLQRKRRSTGSSFANVYSAFGMKHEHGISCSILSCQQACAKNNFNLPKCIPQCTEAGCICICKPELLDSVIDSILASFDDDDVKKQDQGQVMGTFGYDREPLDSKPNSSHQYKPKPTDVSRPMFDQDGGFNLFTAPPSLY